MTPSATPAAGAPLGRGRRTTRATARLTAVLTALAATLAPPAAASAAAQAPPSRTPADTLRPSAAPDTSEAAADARADRAFVREVERGATPYKVLHAEPLYVDLIRDLGARKGEAEWNVGFGLTDRQAFDAYQLLVEYEWAPRDRLGLEIELPATLYSGARVRTRGGAGEVATVRAPASRLDGLKTAVQWTAHVSERRQTSFALGYINELQLADPRRTGTRAVRGNLYNPFVVGAKRWTPNAHTLVYTGVRHEQEFGHGFAPPLVEVNASAHYMLPGTRNFVGLEVNADRERRAMHTVLRPQMRLGITDRLLLGVVVGVPVASDRERLGTFFRLIYEPSHRMGPRATTPATPGA